MRLIKHTPEKWKKFVKSRTPISESIIPLSSKGTNKKWSAVSDRWLLSYAQWSVDENNIENKTGLQDADSWLYSALFRRNDQGGVRLLDMIEFKSDERAWSKYSDDELVDYAQKFVNKNNIKNKQGLRNADSGLHDIVYRRKDPYGVRLLNKIEFEAGQRPWSKYSNDELVTHAQKLVDENNIKNKKGLENADSGLHGVLYKRKDPDGETLLDKIKFKTGLRSWSKYSNAELVDYAQKFVDKNGINNKTGLRNADSGLHAALYKRKDQDGVRLLDKIEFKAGNRLWRNYSNDELVKHAQKFVDENNIKNKKGLQKVDPGLYQALWGRNLLDRVFEPIDQNQRLQGLQEIADAMEEF
jgi:hypothetical protein